MIPVNMLSDGTVIERSDECLGVRFFMYPNLDEVRSQEEGRPVYAEIEMVEIIIPGCKDIFHGKVSDAHKARFRKKYEAFKELTQHKVEGTPLNQFPFISVGEIKELEYFNIYTGEQLVNMPDGNIDKLGVNGRDLIKKVKAYMASAKDSSVVGKLSSENESLKREMELIKEQMQQILMFKEEDRINGSQGVEPTENGKNGSRGRKRQKVGIADLDENGEVFLA